MNSLYSRQMIKRTELLCVREFVCIMVESRPPVNATTVEHHSRTSSTHMAKFFPLYFPSTITEASYGPVGPVVQ